ncbi:MAG: aldo/keto reductase, partial [Promethearchaeota archaeon]
MNSLNPSLQLPPIGLGTWMLKPQKAEHSVFEGLKMGYRFVDTAQTYGNETAVGQGLSRAFETLSLPRKDVIVATKINPIHLHPRIVYKSAIKSLKKLGIETIDILYVHWPAFKLGYSHNKTLKIFDKLIEDGVIQHIGLSNFTVPMLEDAQKSCQNPIFAHQVEHHPYLPQANMLSYLTEHQIHMISYSPLARGEIMKDSVLQSIGEQHH